MPKYRVVLKGVKDNTKEGKKAFLKKLAEKHKTTPEEMSNKLKRSKGVLYKLDNSKSAERAKAFLEQIGGIAKICPAQPEVSISDDLFAVNQGMADSTDNEINDRRQEDRPWTKGHKERQRLGHMVEEVLRTEKGIKDQVLAIEYGQVRGKTIRIIFSCLLSPLIFFLVFPFVIPCWIYAIYRLAKEWPEAVRQGTPRLILYLNLVFFIGFGGVIGIVMALIPILIHATGVWAVVLARTNDSFVLCHMEAIKVLIPRFRKIEVYPIEDSSLELISRKAKRANYRFRTSKGEHIIHGGLSLNEANDIFCDNLNMLLGNRSEKTA